MCLHMLNMLCCMLLYQPMFREHEAATSSLSQHDISRAWGLVLAKTLLPLTQGIG